MFEKSGSLTARGSEGRILGILGVPLKNQIRIELIEVEMQKMRTGCFGAFLH